MGMVSQVPPKMLLRPARPSRPPVPVVSCCWLQQEMLWPLPHCWFWTSCAVVPVLEPVGAATAVEARMARSEKVAAARLYILRIAGGGVA